MRDTRRVYPAWPSAVATLSVFEPTSAIERLQCKQYSRLCQVSLSCQPMNFFSVCSCDDRKSKEARRPKEEPVEAPGSSAPAAVTDKDPLFDGLVLARSPQSAELGHSFDPRHLDGSLSPVPRAAAVLPRAASDVKEPSPSPLPSPSSRRSWRHAMAEVIPDCNPFMPHESLERL
jgi:hypothetical protein